jgi:tetratricopeptide (TPR) repeat protein
MPLSRNWLLVLLLGLCGMLYFPGLQGPMLFDDYPQLEGLLRNSHLSFIRLIQDHLISDSGPLGRPVSMLTFILDAHFWGSTLWRWKMTNVLLHLATALSLYWFLTALLRPTLQPKEQKIWLALFVCGVWILHPMHVSTVLYTVQRMTILSALFAILSMATYLEGRLRIQDNKSNGYAWLALSIAVFFPLSAFSKENGLLIPVYLILLEWLFFPESRWRNTWRNLAIPRKAVLMTVTVIAGAAALTVIVQHFVQGGYAARPFTLNERLLTELRVISTYLWQIVAPSWSNLGLFHDDIALSKGLLTPPSTLPSLIFLTSLIWLGLKLRKTNPVASFGILFFFSSHLMESTIIPLELMFEHRNYLGSAGIILAISSITLSHWQRPRMLAVFALLIPSALALVLYQFSSTWSDSSRLNAHLYTYHPNSPSVIAMTADQYALQGNPDQALRLLDRPERVGYRLQSLVIQCNLTHRLENTELEKLNNSIQGLMQSYELTGFIELSNHWLDRTCDFSDKLFIEALQLAIAHTANKRYEQKLLVYQSHIYHQTGRLSEAIQSLEAAFTASPTSPMPLFLATEWLLNEGDKARAKVYYQRALAASKRESAITSEYISHFEKRITPELIHDSSH